jgi:hypothetical protein
MAVLAAGLLGLWPADGRAQTPVPQERRVAPAPAPASPSTDPLEPPPDAATGVRSLRRPWPSRGFYFAGEVGPQFFVGNIGHASKPGVIVGARGGYDLFKWLGVGARATASVNATDFPPPPGPNSFQSFYYGAEARFAYRRERLSLMAQGGYGLMQLSSNILETAGAVPVGSRFSGAFSAGLGVDWHTRNRHFSFGLAVDAVVPQSFGGSAQLAFTPYLMYTH